MSNQTERETLKPCPFCGGTQLHISGEFIFGNVYCEACYAQGPPRLFKVDGHSDGAPIWHAWNHRAAHPPEQENAAAQDASSWSGMASTEALGTPVAAAPIAQEPLVSVPHRLLWQAFNALDEVDYENDPPKRILDIMTELRAAKDAAPQVAQEPVALPELPEPAGAITVDEGPAGPLYMEGARIESYADGYSADQMRAYATLARESIEAELSEAKTKIVELLQRGDELGQRLFDAEAELSRAKAATAHHVDLLRRAFSVIEEIDFEFDPPKRVMDLTQAMRDAIDAAPPRPPPAQ